MSNYRAVFVSDLHLGYGRSKAEALVAFLDGHDSDYLYLVGDVIDLQRMARRSHWTASCTKVLAQILRKANQGTIVHYVLGNHDATLRLGIGQGMSLSNIQLCDQAEHLGLDHKRYLVIHGDQVDQSGNRMSRPVLVLCHKGYTALLYLNMVQERTLARWGLRSLNLVDFFRRRFRTAQVMVRNFEDSVAAYARARHYDGVVCGHIHYPQIRTIECTEYRNCGDWLEHCSAVVEHHDGRWEVIKMMAG